jgi:NAD(P)-dependent dehydrogenase (short-subunit alcohol dehydrogenase family)
LSREAPCTLLLENGGSRGLGKAAAQKLASAGAQVIILARDPRTLASAAAEIVGPGGRVVTGACDLGDASEIERVAPHLVEQLDGIDILVNNDGSSLRRPLLELTASEFVS